MYSGGRVKSQSEVAAVQHSPTACCPELGGSGEGQHNEIRSVSEIVVWTCVRVCVSKTVSPWKRLRFNKTTLRRADPRNLQVHVRICRVWNRASVYINIHGSLRCAAFQGHRGKQDLNHSNNSFGPGQRLLHWSQQTILLPTSSKVCVRTMAMEVKRYPIHPQYGREVNGVLNLLKGLKRYWFVACLDARIALLQLMKWYSSEFQKEHIF